MAGPRFVFPSRWRELERPVDGLRPDRPEPPVSLNVPRSHPIGTGTLKTGVPVVYTRERVDHVGDVGPRLLPRRVRNDDPAVGYNQIGLR